MSELEHLASFFHQDFDLMEMSPQEAADAHVRKLCNGRRRALKRELEALLSEYPGVDNRGLHSAWLRAGANWWDSSKDLRAFTMRVEADL